MTYTTIASFVALALFIGILAVGLFGWLRSPNFSFSTSQESGAVSVATSEQMPVLQAPINSGVLPSPIEVSDAVATTSPAQPITFPKD